MSIEKSNIDVGNRIFSVRKQLGLIQKDFAEKVGISPNFLSEVERSISPPSKTLLIAISLRYSINFDWLLTGEGEMFAGNAAGDHIPEAETDGEDIRKALAKTLVVLQSGTLYGKALMENIESFYQAVQTESHLRKTEDRLKKVEQDLEELHDLNAHIPELLERMSGMERHFREMDDEKKVPRPSVESLGEEKKTIGG